MTDFVHLHVYPDYSQDNHAGLQSIATIEDLVDKAASLGMEYRALTNNMYFSLSHLLSGLWLWSLYVEHMSRQWRTSPPRERVS